MVGCANNFSRIGLACLLVGACGACDAVMDEPGAAQASPVAGEAQLVARLPLRPGYYVAADVPCGEASNATLHLRRRDGDSYGGFTTPPYSCMFTTIEQTGPSSYRAAEECGSDHGGQGEPETSVVAYEILSDTSYSAVNDDGWEGSARRCPRQQLPGYWRDLGLGDYVD